MLEHPVVAESAVVAVPDVLRGQIVKAFIVLAGGYKASDALTAEIQEFVKTNTAPYKYPRQIEYRDALPKTISARSSGWCCAPRTPARRAGEPYSFPGEQSMKLNNRIDRDHRRGQRHRTRRLALRFAQEKPAGLVLADLLAQQTALSALAKDLNDGANGLPPVPTITQLGDVGREADVQALAKAARERFGHIDLFCSNAGLIRVTATRTRRTSCGS
ncbi:MAG: hypothetical protein R3E68_18720 [Burkholderiaceae bacterium]